MLYKYLNAKQLLRSTGSAAKLDKLRVRKVAIIGAGIIGLTLAKKLKGQMPGLLIDIFDKYSFPLAELLSGIVVFCTQYFVMQKIDLKPGFVEKEPIRYQNSYKNMACPF